MDALEKLQQYNRLHENLVLKCIMENHYGTDTCVRNYGDLTVDKSVRRNPLDIDDDDDDLDNKNND